MQSRNINYASGNMLFGSLNTIQLEAKLELDVLQLSQQADVFARELFSQGSKLDLKRFLGTYRDDWLRLLHEAYVYDRCKCIYYGMNSIYLQEFPKDRYSFPGNVLLAHLIRSSAYQYNTKDSQPYSLFFSISINRNPEEFLKDVFKAYPEIKEGMSNTAKDYVYVNSLYETVLTGLHDGKLYLEKNKLYGNKPLYEMIQLNDDKVLSFFMEDSFPFMNSFLSSGGTKFKFILPSDKSKPEALRFNESIFLPRAVGLISDGIVIQDNHLYKTSIRQEKADFFTRDEVFSVTGLRSEITPLSQDQIKKYLNIGPKRRDYGGSNPKNP